MSIFKYELRGLKWPETKIQKKKKKKNIIPHHHSYLNPQSSILVFCFLEVKVVVLHYYRAIANFSNFSNFLSEPKFLSQPLVELEC